MSPVQRVSSKSTTAQPSARRVPAVSTSTDRSKHAATPAMKRTCLTLAADKTPCAFTGQKMTPAAIAASSTRLTAKWRPGATSAAAPNRAASACRRKCGHPYTKRGAAERPARYSTRCQCARATCTPAQKTVWYRAGDHGIRAQNRAAAEHDRERGVWTGMRPTAVLSARLSRELAPATRLLAPQTARGFGWIGARAPSRVAPAGKRGSGS